MNSSQLLRTCSPWKQWFCPIPAGSHHHLALPLNYCTSPCFPQELKACVTSHPQILMATSPESEGLITKGNGWSPKIMRDLQKPMSMQLSPGSGSVTPSPLAGSSDSGLPAPKGSVSANTFALSFFTAMISDPPFTEGAPELMRTLIPPSPYPLLRELWQSVQGTRARG